MAPPLKASPKPTKAAAPTRISLGVIPVRVMTLDMVFDKFVSIGKVFPEEKGRFTEYVLDLSPFVQKDVLRLATARFPPFTNAEVKAVENDTVRLENFLDNYLRYSAKSEARSHVWYERPGTKMRLAVRIFFPRHAQNSPSAPPPPNSRT
ncbi:MAG: hypothetical protein N3E51_03585 [Candidatus Micrarchaeota archaeon]|nr:hypothetical protein [Candidatus Micrarchaeota archaeon]